MILILATLSARPVTAQQGAGAFDPFPNGTAHLYQFDLARNFFPSAEAERIDRSRLQGALGRFAATRERAATSPDRLLATLRQADSLRVALNKHFAYLSLRYNTDSRDGEATSAAAALSDTADAVLGPLRLLLANIDEPTLSGFIARVPALRTYEYLVVQSRRARAHMPSAEAEAVLRTAEPEMVGWQPDLFWELYRATPWGTVTTPEGALDLARNGGAIFSHPDRRVRQEGFEKNRAGGPAR